jgi:hypothetical protein
MIDTLRLNLSDCEISSHTPIIIERSPYLHDSQQQFIDYDLFVDNSGEIVTGKKAYYNSEKFNITINPKYTLKVDAIEEKHLIEFKLGDMKVGLVNQISKPEEKFNAGVFVQASLPRYLHPTNFNSLSISDEKNVLNQLEKDLAGIGIKTNIWDSTISRIDAFTNLITEENFNSYSNLFSIIQGTRLQNYTYNGETFLWKNGEKQITCYDKIKDLKAKIKDETFYGFLPANVMRIETRNLRKRKIRSALGFVNIKDLFKNYDYLKENHRSEIETTIFKYDVTDVERMTGNFIKEDMEYFYKKGSGYWFSNYLKMFGVASLLKLSDMETIIEKVNEIIDNDENRTYKNRRMIKSRIKKMMNELRFKMESSKLNSYVSTKTNRELYNELKSKFNKQAA